MKITALFLWFSACHCCFAASDTDIVALGDWSAPVASDNGFSIRGRLLMCKYPVVGPRRTDSLLTLSLELEECFHSGIGQVYYYASEGLNCHLTDAAGRNIPSTKVYWGALVSMPCWLTLPSYSRARVCASFSVSDTLPDGGLKVILENGQSWMVEGNDTNTFYLSGTFTDIPTTNHPPNDAWRVWKGTLNLPKMKVPTGGR